MECKDCKKLKNCKNKSIKWCEKSKNCKNLLYCKKCDIVYEDRKCYLEYLKAIKKCFVFKCLECEQNKQYHQKIIY